jgi:hypothetical protein
MAADSEAPRHRRPPRSHQGRFQAGPRTARVASGEGIDEPAYTERDHRPGPEPQPQPPRPTLRPALLLRASGAGTRPQAEAVHRIPAEETCAQAFGHISMLPSLYLDRCAHRDRSCARRNLLVRILERASIPRSTVAWDREQPPVRLGTHNGFQRTGERRLFGRGCCRLITAIITGSLQRQGPQDVAPALGRSAARCSSRSS